MTKDELIKARKDIMQRAKAELIKAGVNYADSNNPYKIGDVIKDNYQTGKITAFTYDSLDSEYPSVVYICEQLKADGTPRKKTEIITIYQYNIISK